LQLIEPKKLAFRIVAAAKSKKAVKVVVLDMRGVCSFCDYFVILSGTSLRQVNALAQTIEADLDKDRIKTLSKVSPNDESGWVVLDYVSVVVHIFYKPMREFYSLERLWSDARRVRIPRKL
jgi:ribosome-associated protein